MLLFARLFFIKKKTEANVRTMGVVHLFIPKVTNFQSIQRKIDPQNRMKINKFNWPVKALMMATVCNHVIASCCYICMLADLVFRRKPTRWLKTLNAIRWANGIFVVFTAGLLCAWNYTMLTQCVRECHTYQIPMNIR